MLEELCRRRCNEETWLLCRWILPTATQWAAMLWMFRAGARREGRLWANLFVYSLDAGNVEVGRAPHMTFLPC